MKALRMLLSGTDRAEKDAAIRERLLSAAEFAAAGSVFLFYGSNGEPDTTEIMQKALDMGKKVALPVVINRTEIIFREIIDTKDSHINRYGIREPRDGHEVQPDMDTLIVAPGFAFGENMVRIGYGRGYYDRYLYGKKFMAVMGIAYDFQVVPFIEPDEWDGRLDAVVTDVKVYR